MHSWRCLSSPSQSFPLCSGLGLLHSRLRHCSPFPHSDEQFPHGLQDDQLPSTKWNINEKKAKYVSKHFILLLGHLFIYFGHSVPGQGSVLHGLDSTASPTQSLPPCLGAGFVHSRLRCMVPPPHVTGHWLHTPHDAQFPSTFSNREQVALRSERQDRADNQ